MKAYNYLRMAARLALLCCFWLWSLAEIGWRDEFPPEVSDAAWPETIMGGLPVFEEDVDAVPDWLSVLDDEPEVTPLIPESGLEVFDADDEPVPDVEVFSLSGNKQS